jgi:AraC family transcriptional regulator, regulatory protein of adaptative response / DNA-3-methyladenine glycosylase II
LAIECQLIRISHPGWRSDLVFAPPVAGMGLNLRCALVVGPQVGVAAARQLAGQLVALHGGFVSGKLANPPGLTYTFPTAERLAAAESIGLGMSISRLSTLRELARTAAGDPNLFRPFGTIEEAIARLRAIPGVGEWTAQYIALRAIREMDAFPASDIGLLRGVAKVDGLPRRRVFCFVRNHGSHGGPMQHNICGLRMLLTPAVDR